MNFSMRSAASAAFAAAIFAGFAPAKAAIVEYEVNLTFDAGPTPFAAYGVAGPISGIGTVQGTFTVDDQTNVMETVSVLAVTGSTLIASYTIGPGYSGLGLGQSGGYTSATFYEPGYETPDIKSLFFYPNGSPVLPGDDVFGSKIELYNGLGQRIAEFQLSGTIVAVPEPTASMAMLLGCGAIAATRSRRK